MAKPAAAVPALPGASFHIRDFNGNAEAGAGRRDAFPVVFFDPLDRDNAVELGFDMYSEPNRRAAMDQAAASDAPVATGRLSPIQDGGRQAQTLRRKRAF